MVADTAIGHANDVIPPPKQPSEQEQQGYRIISGDEDEKCTTLIVVSLTIVKAISEFEKEKALEEDDGDPPVEDYDPTEYDRYNEHNELTLRTIIVGCLIGILISAMNVNFGLRTGWCQGGSVFASIIAIGIFKIINPVVPFTKWETCLAVTAASAAGTMTSAAGLVSSMPALKMLGNTYTVWQHYAWAFAVAYFGVYFAVPLRRQLIVVEKLRFPSGTATAMTIKAMFAKGDETVQKAKALLFCAIASGIWTISSFFIPLIEDPPMPLVLHRYGFTLHLSPMLFGGGMLSGPRATGSLVLGAIVGWGIVGPIVQAKGYAPGAPMSYVNGIRGWILWVGVAIMAADSAIQLLFTAKVMVVWVIDLIKRGRNQERIDTSINPLKEMQRDLHMIPWYYPTVGLIISTIILTLIGHFVFDIKYYFVWAAIPLGAILAMIAARCCGETDINPVGSMGKVTQLVFAGLAPRQVITNVLSAAIVAAGASQCGDMMQDLKTGYMMRVAPKKVFLSQCIGIVAGIIVCVPIYKLYDTAYTVGGDDLPAPAAHAWKAVAVILSSGVSALPPSSGYGILFGAIVGVVLAITNKLVGYFGGEKRAYYVPSALAVGIGMIVPPRQSLIMFAGACMYLIWKRGWPVSANKYFFAVSSGLIAGEGLMGIVVAALRIFNVHPFVTSYYYPPFNSTISSNSTTA
jgi:OPT family oligopeptide transporter